MNDAWRDVLVAAISTLPSIIAAVASIRNGKALNQHADRAEQALRAIQESAAVPKQ